MQVLRNRPRHPDERPDTAEYNKRQEYGIGSAFETTLMASWVYSSFSAAGLLVQCLALGVLDFDPRIIRIARIVGLVIVSCLIPEVVITRLNFVEHVTKRHPWIFSNMHVGLIL